MERERRTIKELEQSSEYWNKRATDREKTSIILEKNILEKNI